jgi:predicted phage replisome organizer
MASKKYYWLKLKRDFFKRHDIRIIEEMPNGKDYILFYLKLLLESIDHEGNLRFSDAIPYNEQMLSVVTNTNVDIVKAAMKLFIELNMIEVFDDQTIYMNEVEKLIGSETDSAERVRRHRLAMQASSDNALQCNTDVTTSNESVTQSKSKKKSIEKDLELDVDVVEEDDSDTDNDDETVDNSVDNSTLELMGGTLGKGVVLLTDAQRDALLDKLGIDAFNHYIAKLADFIIRNKATVSNHYNTILKWAKEDMKV